MDYCSPVNRDGRSLKLTAKVSGKCKSPGQTNLNLQDRKTYTLLDLFINPNLKILSLQMYFDQTVTWNLDDFEG